MSAMTDASAKDKSLALFRNLLLTSELNYQVVRASMVIVFSFFGYQKWFP
jgi:hypothetical protein